VLRNRGGNPFWIQENESCDLRVCRSTAEEACDRVTNACDCATHGRTAIRARSKGKRSMRDCDLRASVWAALYSADNSAVAGREAPLRTERQPRMAQLFEETTDAADGESFRWRRVLRPGGESKERHVTLPELQRATGPRLVRHRDDARNAGSVDSACAAAESGQGQRPERFSTAFARCATRTALEFDAQRLFLSTERLAKGETVRRDGRQASPLPAMQAANRTAVALRPLPASARSVTTRRRTCRAGPTPGRARSARNDGTGRESGLDAGGL